MSALSRDAILAAKDLKSEVVKVPEWGGEVTIATMSGEQRDAWEQSFIGEKGKVNTTHARERLLVYCVVDEKGAPMFTEADIAALAKKSSAAVVRCAEVAQRLNYLGAEAVKDAVKN